jgi:hypothetical protein
MGQEMDDYGGRSIWSQMAEENAREQTKAFLAPLFGY